MTADLPTAEPREHLTEGSGPLILGWRPDQGLDQAALDAATEMFMSLELCVRGHEARRRSHVAAAIQTYLARSESRDA